MQRMIVIVVGVLIVAMLLFPPFQEELMHGARYHVGYGFLFKPGHALLNVSTLLTQWVGVLIAGTLAWVVAGEAFKRPTEGAKGGAGDSATVSDPTQKYVLGVAVLIAFINYVLFWTAPTGDPTSRYYSEWGDWLAMGFGAVVGSVGLPFLAVMIVSLIKRYVMGAWMQTWGYLTLGLSVMFQLVLYVRMANTG